jgi:hypothetical protein
MRCLTRAGDERVAFWLTWTMLRRDYGLRMRCWPAFSVMAALLAVGAITGQLTNTFTSTPAECVMTLGAVYLLGASLPALFHNLRFSQEHPAAWVLEVAPLADRIRFVRGQMKALLIHFLIPAAAIMLVLFCWLWRNPLHAAIHVLLAWSVMWGMAWVLAGIQLRKIPFSAPLSRGESFGPIAPLAGATAGVGMGLAALHAWSLARVEWFAAFVVLVVAASIMAGFAVRRSLGRGGAGGIAS